MLAFLLLSKNGAPDGVLADPHLHGREGCKPICFAEEGFSVLSRRNLARDSCYKRGARRLLFYSQATSTTTIMVKEVGPIIISGVSKEEEGLGFDNGHSLQLESTFSLHWNTGHLRSKQDPRRFIMPTAQLRLHQTTVTTQHPVHFQYISLLQVLIVVQVLSLAQGWLVPAVIRMLPSFFVVTS